MRNVINIWCKECKGTGMVDGSFCTNCASGGKSPGWNEIPLRSTVLMQRSPCHLAPWVVTPGQPYQCSAQGCGKTYPRESVVSK